MGFKLLCDIAINTLCAVFKYLGFTKAFSDLYL